MSEAVIKNEVPEEVTAVLLKQKLARTRRLELRRLRCEVEHVRKAVDGMSNICKLIELEENRLEQIEAERKAKAIAEDSERIRAEYERLKAEAEAREKSVGLGEQDFNFKEVR